MALRLKFSVADVIVVLLCVFFLKWLAATFPV